MPTGTGQPAGGEGDQNVGEGSLQEPSRGRSHRMPSSAANGLATGHTTEFVGNGRRFMGIEKHVAVRCPCCDATDVDPRHARICPRAGTQVSQHQPILHAISRTLKRLGVPHQAEIGEPFAADRNLRMGIVVRRRGLRNAPYPGIPGHVHSSGCDPRRPASTGSLVGRQR